MRLHVEFRMRIPFAERLFKEIRLKANAAAGYVDGFGIAVVFSPCAESEIGKRTVLRIDVFRDPVLKLPAGGTYAVRWERCRNSLSLAQNLRRLKSRRCLDEADARICRA